VKCTIQRAMAGAAVAGHGGHAAIAMRTTTLRSSRTKESALMSSVSSGGSTAGSDGRPVDGDQRFLPRPIGGTEPGSQGSNPAPLSSPTTSPTMPPCPGPLPPRPRPCFSLTTSATGHGQTADQGVTCTLLLRNDRPGRGSEGDETMTTTYPRAGQWHRSGRSPRKAGPWRASPRGLPGCPLRRPLGNPLWCPAPQAGGKPLVRAAIGAKTAPLQPSSLLLLSVVEESIGFRGARTPSQAGRGQRRRLAGGRSRATREQS
jgi:hypothetical protein